MHTEAQVRNTVVARDLIIDQRTTVGGAEPRDSPAPEAIRPRFLLAYTSARRSADELATGDSLGSHEFRKRYLADFVAEVSSALETSGFEVRSVSEEVGAAESRMQALTCDAAAVLVDRDALGDSHLLDVVPVLRWRRRLGLPAYAILLGNVTLGEVRASALGDVVGERELQVLVPPSIKQNRDVRARQVAQVRDAVVAVPPKVGESPSVRWIRDLRRVIASVDWDDLAPIAQRLDIDPRELADSEDPRGLIVSALFMSDLGDAYRFLSELVPRLDAEGTDAIVERAKPIWVDLDSARLVLDASELPKDQRICGFETMALRLGRQVVERASAAAPGYHVVNVPDVTGELPAEELLRRYDETLRTVLHLLPDDSPDEIERELDACHAAVFALLRFVDLNVAVTRRLIAQLSERFPGITFVLLSDRKSEVWRQMHDVLRPRPPWEREREREARRHVSRLGGLAGQRIMAGGDE